MSFFRVVFLGTPDFSVKALETLMEDEHIEIAAVVTQPDRPAGRKMQMQASPVKERAQKADLTIFAPENINSPQALAELKTLRADIAVVVAYGQILSQQFLDLFPFGAVNLHASLLPRWRGAAPIQRSIMAGDPETGVTLQRIVFKLDAGDILGTRVLTLTDEMDAEIVYEKLKNLGSELLALEMIDYLRGNLVGLPQEESKVTIAKKIKKEEGLLDFKKSARDLFNLYRGIKIWPGVWTVRSGKTLKFHKMKLREDVTLNPYTKPGEVMEVHAQSFVVACGMKALEVLEVQMESRSRMTVQEYLKGNPMQKGEVLGAYE